MTTTIVPDVAAVARWRLLSIGLSVPTEEGLAEIEALAEALRERESSVELDALLAAVRAADVVDLRSWHQALFGGTVAVPPYEGSYELDPIRQGRELADVAAFYRAFGADAHGPAFERPDHAGCELEFLAYLELRRLEADDADAAVLDDIAAAFLRDHPGRWLPVFFTELREAAAGAPFFHALAPLGLRAVREELERRGVEPSPVRPRAGRRARLPVERDSFECA